jgi:hypothetical protein
LPTTQSATAEIDLLCKRPCNPKFGPIAIATIVSNRASPACEIGREQVSAGIVNDIREVTGDISLIAN